MKPSISLCRPGRSARHRIMLGLLLMLGLASPCFGQRIVLEQRLRTKGTVESQQNGILRIKSDDGERLELKYQGPDDNAVALGGAQSIVNFPAEIRVAGSTSVEGISKGQFVRLKVRLKRGGKFEETVPEVELLTATAEPSLEPQEEPDDDGFAMCHVVGQVMATRRTRIALQVIRSPFAASGRLAVPVDEATTVSFEDDDLKKVRSGDKVTALAYARFSTGDLVIEKIDVEQIAGGGSSIEADPLEVKFAKFSDEPSQPRDVRSANFVLHTDISDRQAQILLYKLEVMIDLVSKYFGQRPKKPIECYVVRDLSQWPPGSLDPTGVAKIASGEGVTLSRSLGKTTRSIVYSCDKHGVVQHESMHAYCAESFGSTGPTWYSEGVAEMGQYWKAGERAVNIDPVVADLLANSQPKKELLDIVAAGQVTGDSWKAYAWRWALCHLLANNPNYSGQFKRLGLAMMSKKPDTFESAYGAVANEISFEYAQFVEHVANGYRVDLCAWQWNKRFSPLRGSRKLKVDIDAAYGWQASGLEVEAEATYRVLAEGQIKLSKSGEEVSADGNAQGRGKLVGVIFKDFELSEPFELGAQTTFTPDQGGLLYLRCLDDFTALADNSGEWSVTLSRDN